MLEKVAEIVLRKCMGAKKGEKILIVTDETRKDIAEPYYNIGNNLGFQTSIIIMKSRKMHGEEPPIAVAEALKNVDIALLITAKSLSHTKARKTACKKYGVRIASMPEVTGKIMQRAIPIDYKKLNHRIQKYVKLLTDAKHVEIRTSVGTDIKTSFREMKGFADTGIYTKKGSFGNLPAGEACIAPKEGSTNGQLVVDLSMACIGKLATPLTFEIKNGFVTKIKGRRAGVLKKILSGYGKSARNIAEFGIGLNPKAKVTGFVIEDEKVLGTSHIAIGNNKSFGGKIDIPLHLDGVFSNPAVIIDGRRIL